ncbi:yellow laccase [Mycena albidolilacea]|uniref:laccase n=1 Tax=Mycena albidolilacea TaxID=1033008 RepID=A0AAD6ZAC2_9AGAR|nr:yellow laccase [Mycena albidolilacea]
MHLHSILALSLPLSFLRGAVANSGSIGPIANLPIVNKRIAPDGFTRSTVLAGGTFPGPLIKGFKGSRFILNVEDKLTDNTMLRSTSIHWHGFFQKNTSWADGPSFVTQCPIAANHSFLYDFQAPGQAGTYWYHSHLSTQYCDGLRGPMVVYDLFDPQRHLYDVDDDSTVITLADWYHFVAPSAPAIPVANSTLINGLGRYAGGPASPLAVISVRKNTRYRFRLVAMSCDPNYIFSIDGHSMTIIEVDGVNHKPLTVDSLQIFAGQRYSFVLNANQKVDNYWVRANPNLGLVGFDGGINSAILRYVGAPTVEPKTNSTGTTALVETALHPLVQTPVPGKPFPGGADINLNLNIALDFATFKFTINGATFVPPTLPVMLQVLSGAQAAQDLLPAGSVYSLPPNKVIEISIPGGAPGAPHPFHLHGHNFHVIRSAGNDTYNFNDPVIRDVVSTGPLTTDNTTFRFVTDNAGPWFLHCHIDWHLEIGLAVVFSEDAPTLKKEKVPVAWNQLCPIYDALTPDQL